MVRLRKEVEMALEGMTREARVADALAHPARIAILAYVAENNAAGIDVCTSDLVTLLDYSQGTVSQHVKKLVQTGLLRTGKRDRCTLYHLCRGEVEDHIAFLKKLLV